MSTTRERDRAFFTSLFSLPMAGLPLAQQIALLEETAPAGASYRCFCLLIQS